MDNAEKRAHDIAIRILPQMLEKRLIDYEAYDQHDNKIFNAGDIADVYKEIYEDLLTEIEKL